MISSSSSIFSTTVLYNTLEIGNDHSQNALSRGSNNGARPERSLFLKLVKLGMWDIEGNYLFDPQIPIPRISSNSAKRFSDLLNSDVNCCNKEGIPFTNLPHSKYITGFHNFFYENGVLLKPYLRGSYVAYICCFADYLEDLIMHFLCNKFSDAEIKEIMPDLCAELHQMKANEYKCSAPLDIDWAFFSSDPNLNLETLRSLNIQFMAIAMNTSPYEMKSQGFINLKIPKPSPLFPLPSNYVISSIGNPLEGNAVKTDCVTGYVERRSLFSRDDHLLPFTLNVEGAAPESTHVNFWEMIRDREFKFIRMEKWHIDDFRSG
ncbi:MAG: hypothetical protein H0W50_11155, partial [Parachlamydiaceae bacterium]|nr:hypothetical protein [Parachlamydiaceae bacterium]